MRKPRHVHKSPRIRKASKQPKAKQPGPAARMTPTAVSLADAARVLTQAAGAAVTAEQLAEDIDLGAPANPDGTLNLVHYAAWLVRAMAAGGH